MLDKYATDFYNTEETALRNLILQNLRSAIATRFGLISYRQYELMTQQHHEDDWEMEM